MNKGDDLRLTGAMSTRTLAALCGNGTMSTVVYYWAVPPSSELFRRLQNEKTFATLMGRIFRYGVFNFLLGTPGDEFWARGREDSLQWIIRERRDVLGPEDEARRWIEEFRLALDQTRSAYPGIEHRQCELWRAHSLQEQLFRHVRVGDGTDILDDLLWGEQELAPNLTLHDDDQLGLVSAPMVQKGAQALTRVHMESTFDFADDFEDWRQLYSDAAAHDEALLIGIA
jgi:hypothetical protein